jgi:hypothetical protein
MHRPFESYGPMTDLQVSTLWDMAASEVGWTRRQMLIAEGLDPDLNRDDGDDDFRSLFPLTGFGSDLWLKRQILPVLCLAYQDIKEQLDGDQSCLQADPDKYVSLIIAPRHRRFFRLVGELEERLPWIAKVIGPANEASAVAVHRRFKHLGLGSKVRIRYVDLGEERFVV